MQWKKEYASRCCSADVCHTYLCQSVNQLYNNNKMAKLVHFSSAWTFYHKIVWGLQVFARNITLLIRRCPTSHDCSQSPLPRTVLKITLQQAHEYLTGQEFRTNDRCLSAGFLECLAELTKVGDVSKEEFMSKFKNGCHTRCITLNLVIGLSKIICYSMQGCCGVLFCPSFLIRTLKTQNVLFSPFKDMQLSFSYKFIPNICQIYWFWCQN